MSITPKGVAFLDWQIANQAKKRRSSTDAWSDGWDACKKEMEDQVADLQAKLERAEAKIELIAERWFAGCLPVPEEEKAGMEAMINEALVSVRAHHCPAAEQGE